MDRLKFKIDKWLFKPWGHRSRIANGWFQSYWSLLTLLLLAPSAQAIPLSPGDRLEVSIPDDSYFARVYEVNQDGNLEIPYLGLLPVAGLEPEVIREQLSTALIEAQFFPEDSLQLSIQVVQWSQVYVSVSGDVFQPGRVLVNRLYDPLEQPEATQQGNIQIPGRYRPERYLSNAIRAAAGVLPTADIQNVIWIRGDEERIFDLSGFFTGEPVEDIPVIAGDQIIVPSVGEIQPEFVRPSAITPAGIKVFMSNLTMPAPGNAGSGVNNQLEGLSFPYGARFNQAVVAGNCAGGTQVTNAHRYAALVKVDRVEGTTVVLERSIESLLRDPLADDGNPFLMPGNAVVCYDSTVTNIRDVSQTFSEILSPLNLLGQVLNFIF
ncbi:MAG: polysaccharide biosynthesis/export family protein [Cyanobacteria bacterium P01_F01_bin.86]